MTSTTPRNPKVEAQALVGDDYAALVLEPSPPAVTDGPYFADDPVDASAVTPAGATLGPAGLQADIDWDHWLSQHPDNADWVSERWLGGRRRLPAAPATLIESRIALHRLAVYAMAPVRHQANGKFGLRWTLGGFGTPFFKTPTGDLDRQVRVEGMNLIDQVGDEVRVASITTLDAAVDFLGSEIRTDAGAESDSPEVGDVTANLAVDPAAAEFLGAWFGMAFAALEQVRSDPASVDPSRPQLWPGHFDPAIEVGDEDHRGSYGASPGDDGIDEPYLYVSIWWPDKIGIDTSDPVWNAPSFTGAVLKLSDFPADADPVTVAAEFWKSTRDRLG